MPIRYRIDVLEALKRKGYSSYQVRIEKKLSEYTIQQLRRNELVSWKNLGRLCAILSCQPGDIIEYVPE